MAQNRATIRVQGLDCPSEVPPIRRALEGQPGVSALAFDPSGGTVEVTFDPSQTNPIALARRVTESAGMKAQAIVGPVLSAGAPAAGAPAATGRVPLAERLHRWGPVLGSGLALGLGTLLQWRGGSELAARALFVLAIVVGGLELFPKAARSLRRLRLDIHVLMALAVVGAAATGQWDEAATVAFLFGLSEAIEALSLERARRAVRSLLEIAPETAERIGPDGATTSVPAAEVRPGDRVRIRASERVPIDGRVLAGRSSVDQQAITGESVPLLREPGDPVFAGTVNGDGTLEVEATAALGDAVITRIVERVRAAQAGRTPVERTIERFAAWYTPAVFALALLVMILPPLLAGASWGPWFHQGLVMLVIACPCALVIGTPVAVVSALTTAARRGILIKDGQFLEGFGQLKTLAFDKTGTLTLGRPDVVEVVAAAGGPGDGDDVLRIAAALGDSGGHVLGRAIARHARERDLVVPAALDYQAVPGLGANGRVEATLYHMGSHRYLDESGLCRPEFHDVLGRAERDAGTSVAVSAPGGPLGWLRLADRPRPEAARAVADLKALGIAPIMLTGDNAVTAAAVAGELGISDVRAALLPAEKANVVAELDRDRGQVGMVGDGVNDAPALAAARVSVAMGGIGSGAALETADIVLLGADLGGLPWLVRHSRRSLRVIRAGIAIAVGTKLVFLALAALGYANLWLAILADMGVSLFVVALALRLLRDRS